MEKENNNEKRFAEYLDRVLAGEELTAVAPDDAELHKALEFAGKIKSLRSDPSATFSESLKQRLLAQMAEREAVAQSEKKSFWPAARARFEGLFPENMQRYALPATALLLVALVATAVVLRSGFSNVNQSSGGYAQRPLPANLRVNFPGTAPATPPSFDLAASTVDLPKTTKIESLGNSGITIDSMTNLGQRLGLAKSASLIGTGVIGMTDEKTGASLEGYVSSGVITYSSGLTGRRAPVLPDNIQAASIAQKYISQMGLTPYNVVFSGEVREDIWSGKSPYISVRFASVVGSVPTTGPSPAAEVRVGDNGIVTGFLIWNRDVNYGWDVPLKDPTSFYSDLRNGQGYYTLPPDTLKVIIRRVALAYWLDTNAEKQDYLLPVYEFTGECLDSEGNFLGNFKGWVEARAK